MRLTDDRGRVLDSEYSAEPDGRYIALILESRSGQSRSHDARNPDYNEALTLLLARLAALDGTLADALVDSRRTQQLNVPEKDRRVLAQPVRLAQVSDLDALRKQIGTAQAFVAQSPEAAKGGNSTKRLRLRVDVPGYSPSDALKLAAVLSALRARPPRQAVRQWWDDDVREKFFMEITNREDIGSDLLAPSTARGGVMTASYALVPLVQRGDVVVHYDSRREAIVGVSWAGSSAEPAPIYWVARGTYARRAGERPRWLPGLRVPLSHYQELDPPLALAEIRAHRAELLQLRDRIHQLAGGKPIYFPWIPYQDTLRTFQSYLVKMPRDAIDLFPRLQSAIADLQARSADTGPQAASELLELAVADAAGKAGRRGRGQGFQLNQAEKVAVEVYAMNMATDFYSEDWVVEDVHSSASYDLVCRRGEEVKHVEVKGTVTAGAEVILTPNEVRHAMEYESIALFIVSNITIEHDRDGAVVTAGGVQHVFDPWILEPGRLSPVGFRYAVPAGRDPGSGEPEGRVG